MLRNRKTQKVSGPTRDYRKNLSVRMTDEQYRRLQRYMGLTGLNSTTYFCRLITKTKFRGFSPELNHALHTGVNMIYSNIMQISHHQRAKDMDADAVAKLLFLTDKLCEEIYLLSSQK